MSRSWHSVWGKLLQKIRIPRVPFAPQKGALQVIPKWNRIRLRPRGGGYNRRPVRALAPHQRDGLFRPLHIRFDEFVGASAHEKAYETKIGGVCEAARPLRLLSAAYVDQRRKDVCKEVSSLAASNSSTAGNSGASDPALRGWRRHTIEHCRCVSVL